MNKLLSVVVLLGGALFAGSASAAPWPGFSLGMGIGGWLTNYKRFNVLPEDKRLLITEGDLEHFDSYITEADVKNIKAMGFDHIRLGFDQIVLEESPGVWRERTFRKVDDFIRWCAANGMNVVLNLHKAVGNYCDIPEKVQLLDDEALQARFIALWLEMERRYHDKPGLAFEILNEVRDVDPAKWNGLADRTVRAIRAKNPDRWIVVGPTCWNAPHALGALRVWDDPKVVYTFHMYEPFEFTHQRGVLQASPLAYNRELDYPCDDVERYRGFHRLHGNANSYANVTRIDRRILAERLAPAFAWAKAHPDKILWNGEFGTIRHAPKASRVAYMRDVVSLCREHGIPWCVWNYLSTPNDGNRFSLVDDDTRKILSPELLSACLGECAEGVGASLPANAAHAFSTLRLPATPENWPSQREMLAHSRDCFDEVWFSACNFESLSANEARSAFLAGAARDIRAMGYVASLEFELTIGNDDGPDSPRMPFKDWTGFTGPDGWEGVRCNCPRDPKFHAYFRDQLRHYCSWKPHTIWLDDDVRVENHGKNPNGCYCRRCVDTFAKAEGRAWTRETLVAAMKEDKALAARWRAHCFRGLAEFAYAFCKAVKEFSPETRVGFQYPWADEGQLFILEAMAKAAGEKIAMRPGSCHYHDWNPYGLIDKTYRMQEQMKVLSSRFDLFDRLCPEIETYPRNFTQRTARSLGFEALMHLATGMDSLTWYIAGNAEPCDWYERNVFKAPRANMWLYREYVARNRGAEPVGFGAVPHEIGQGTPGLDWWAAPSCVPYNFGTGRTLGTVLWDSPALHAVSDDGLKAILGGGVLADLAAVRHLVSRRLVPDAAAELDKTLLSDSTERHSRLVTLPSGGRLAVFPSLRPIGATSRELLRYGHLADAVCGGKMPILFEEPALDVVLPRVFADGSFASAVIVNTRIDEQESARVRIRNLKGDAVLWFALWSQAPVRLPIERDAKTGDALVKLPPIGPWSGGFLAPTGER